MEPINNQSLRKNNKSSKRKRKNKGEETNLAKKQKKKHLTANRFTDTQFQHANSRENNSKIIQKQQNTHPDLVFLQL